MPCAFIQTLILRNRGKMTPSSKANELKKQLFKIYNDINKEIYGYGVIELKINFSDGMIIFVTKHNRVPALIVLENRFSQLKQSVDQALFSEFKLMLKDRFMEKFNIEPLAMLRDYDSTYQIAMTVIVLSDEDLKTILK